MCEWYQKQVEFLGYLITGEGFSKSKEKIEIILEWEFPKSVKEV
jgi:hypothetical protein